MRKISIQLAFYNRNYTTGKKGQKNSRRIGGSTSQWDGRENNLPDARIDDRSTVKSRALPGFTMVRSTRA